MTDAGVTVDAYRWFHQETDSELLARDDYSLLLSTACVHYLATKVIYGGVETNEPAEPTPQIFTALQEAILAIKPCLDVISNPLDLLVASEKYCREKGLSGIFD